MISDDGAGEAAGRRADVGDRWCWSPSGLPVVGNGRLRAPPPRGKAEVPPAVDSSGHLGLRQTGVGQTNPATAATGATCGVGYSRWGRHRQWTLPGGRPASARASADSQGRGGSRVLELTSCSAPEITVWPERFYSLPCQHAQSSFAGDRSSAAPAACTKALISGCRGPPRDAPM